jgi:LmbE family N-acetylglucosaminyl deacetylase
LNKLRLAVFGTCPDDVDIGVAGTMAKHAKAGDEVYVVVLTGGELGGGPMPPEDVRKSRIKEEEAACKIYGVKEVRVLDFQDCKFVATLDAKLVLTDVIREIRPDIVMASWINDKHPNLRECGIAVCDACLLSTLEALKTKYPPHIVGNIYLWGSPGFAIGFQPDLYIDITDTIELKKKGLEQFKLSYEASWAGSKDIWFNYWGEAVPRVWGFNCGVKYAEAFKTYYIPLHCGKSAMDLLPRPDMSDAVFYQLKYTGK